jgi:hypothetical protein
MLRNVTPKIMRSSHDESPTMSRRATALIAARVAGFVVVAELLYVIGVIYALGFDLQAASNFGEMFGGLNVFFAGLGFVGIIITLRKEAREALEAENRQTETFKIMAQQVGLLREQIQADTAPFFHLESDSFRDDVLYVSLRNLGAPVVWVETIPRPGWREVRETRGALSTGGTIEIALEPEGASSEQCVFAARLRDRRGSIRRFAITVDRRRTPTRLDFEEKTGDDVTTTV